MVEFESDNIKKTKDSSEIRTVFETDAGIAVYMGNITFTAGDMKVLGISS